MYVRYLLATGVGCCSPAVFSGCHSRLVQVSGELPACWLPLQVVDGGMVSLEVLSKAGPDITARVVDPGGQMPACLCGSPTCAAIPVCMAAGCLHSGGWAAAEAPIVGLSALLLLLVVVLVGNCI